MIELIAEYGYLAVMVGTILEGEMVVTLGAIFAKLGYLDIGLVILAAFAGTFLADNMFFLIGRNYGDRLLLRWPSWRQRAEKAKRLLRQHDTWFILGFRFVYGVRTVSPFVIGMSEVSPRRFVALDFIAAALWSGAVGGTAFALGSALEIFITRIESYGMAVLAALFLAGMTLWILYLVTAFLRARR